MTALVMGLPRNASARETYTDTKSILQKVDTVQGHSRRAVSVADRIRVASCAETDLGRLKHDTAAV